MGAISLKLPDDLLDASKRCADALRVSRAAYIRRAVERMNRETRALLRAKRLAEVSRKIRKESMRVNAEFAAIERDPDA
jgi:predicted transcriptional regulator